jgi:hypothetical protein
VTQLELPDVPLIRVLYFIDLEDLLLVVNRVCKRLNDIIKYSTVLWIVLEFYDPLNITESDLPCILKHSKKFRVFNIGLSNYTGRLAQLDYFLVTNLSSSKNLIWLTLTRTEISTTCFLQYLPNLEILDLSQCSNLNDCDFHVIRYCTKLEALYLAFNKVEPKTITDVISDKPNLQVLEITGLYLKLSEIHNVLHKCYQSLMSFYVSLHSSVNEDDFEQEINLNYRDLYYHIYKTIE